MYLTARKAALLGKATVEQKHFVAVSRYYIFVGVLSLYAWLGNIYIVTRLLIDHHWNWPQIRPLPVDLGIWL